MLVHNPADVGLVRQGARSCPGLARTTGATGDPGALQLVAADERARGARDPRRPRHRLRRGAQPHPGRRAARRRRPVAVRHLRRPLRRPGAVGLPQGRRRAQHRGRDRARPHPARGRRGGQRPPRPDADRRAGCATRRCSRSPRASSTTTGCCRPSRSGDPGLAGQPGRRRRRPAPPSSSRPSTARSARCRAAPTTSRTPPATRWPWPAGCATTSTGPTTRRSQQVDEASADGTLLRGEVLARWQEFVGTGELLRSLETKVGWLRDRVVGWVRGKPQQAERVTVAVESGLETLILEHAETAAERAEASWRSVTAGQHLARGLRPRPRPASPRLPRRAPSARSATGSTACSRWCAARAPTSGPPPGSSRSASTGSRVALMVVVFAHTAGVSGAEVGHRRRQRGRRPEAARGGLRRPGRAPAGRRRPARTSRPGSPS